MAPIPSVVELFEDDDNIALPPLDSAPIVIIDEDTRDGMYAADNEEDLEPSEVGTPEISEDDDDDASTVDMNVVVDDESRSQDAQRFTQSPSVLEDRTLQPAVVLKRLRDFSGIFPPAAKKMAVGAAAVAVGVKPTMAVQGFKCIDKIVDWLYEPLETSRNGSLGTYVFSSEIGEPFDCNELLYNRFFQYYLLQRNVFDTPLLKDKHFSIFTDDDSCIGLDKEFLRVQSVNTDGRYVLPRLIVPLVGSYVQVTVLVFPPVLDADDAECVFDVTYGYSNFNNSVKRFFHQASMKGADGGYLILMHNYANANERPDSVYVQCCREYHVKTFAFCDNEYDDYFLRDSFKVVRHPFPVLELTFLLSLDAAKNRVLSDAILSLHDILIAFLKSTGLGSNKLIIDQGTLLRDYEDYESKMISLIRLMCAFFGMTVYRNMRTIDAARHLIDKFYAADYIAQYTKTRSMVEDTDKRCQWPLTFVTSDANAIKSHHPVPAVNTLLYSGFIEYAL